MDTRDGVFKKIDQEKFSQQMENKDPMVFREGEVIEIRGSRFRIAKIHKKKMTLKLLKAG
ncbi:MAG: hypothetical protein K9J21_07125 [Bacteroidales bacterium]|nr:hypothetical protein [Bacteroidales bacterium]